MTDNNKTFTLSEVKQLLLEAIADTTADKWANCVKHVIEVEESWLWDLDNRIEAVAPLVIELGEDETMSESD